MSLTVVKNNQIWTVFFAQEAVAEINLDYLSQVNKVLLYAGAPSEIQLDVLQLAASHARSFVRERRFTAWGGLLVAEYGNKNLWPADSDHLMLLQEVPPEIKQLDRETVVRELSRLSIEVSTAIHKTADEAIRDALFRIGITELSYKQVQGQWVDFDGEITVQFDVSNPHHFTYWKCESQPAHNEHDLHLVPSYHPVMNGWNSIGMVNGDTDAYIRGKAIRYIHCPHDARAAGHEERYLSASWSHTKHPYHAIGSSVQMKLIVASLRSNEGVEELVQALRASLGLEKLYICISGGFRAPFTAITNDEWTGYERRGSEKSCVWEYLTLQEEGVLHESYVPAWFTREGWLTRYKAK